MPALFISHASEDDVTAVALEAWLRARGFTDLFIDHSDIDAGEKWAQALRDAAGACRVVVCLVTENWLASDECFSEFRAAWYMGKRIIPLFALAPGDAARRERLGKVRAEDQGLDLAPCLTPDGRLDLARDPEIERRLESGLRAGGALARVGLDPEAFAIDPNLRKTPFPGLASFGDEDADAALFYGRSREIAESLEELRKVRAEGDLRPFVILGASGSGKSSLLKAGIIPRLRREAPAWLPLRAFRPGGDPLLHFAEALARTLKDFGKVEAHGVIRDRLLDAWAKSERADGALTPIGEAALASALETEGRKLRDAADRPGATILISVDQAEELARAEGECGQALAAYLHVALATTASRWELAFTIRTDSFPELQRHRRFQDLKARGYDLRAVPAFRFDSVIEEPARRYGVRVDLTLIDAVIEDAPREDALPLLAFGLQRLWRQYAASGALVFDHYVRVGRLRGLIEDGAERALRGLSPLEEVALPSAPPPKSRLDLAASTFVPALAQVNEQGVILRRIAESTSFGEEQQQLLARFDDWRLVVRKGEPGTVEVAHEALFREWKRLAGWLEPERARLEALRSLQVDALTWDRNTRDVGFLNHRGKRLAEASRLSEIEGYRKRLTSLEFDYLLGCQAAETRERRRERGIQAAIGAMAIGLIAGLLGWMHQGFLAEEWNWYTTMRPYMMANFRPHVLGAEAEGKRIAGPTPKDRTFRECATNCPWMIVIPAGEFLMGSPDGKDGSTKAEDGPYKDEGPQHKVTFARNFAVAKNDVTFDEWDACAAVGGCPKAEDSGMGRGDKPVINVTFDDAERYAKWLSLMTGKDYRLLSEAEWEYSARAGTTTTYFWGDEILEKNANCNRCGNTADGKGTTEVGLFPANKYGLKDMAGNVWQWVEDCYHKTYVDAPVDGEAWTSRECGERVLRGGSWSESPRGLRSANRNHPTAMTRFKDIGFRVARTLTP
jgi:formylglycine-generating enzyme required for sulfatase activity